MIHRSRNALHDKILIIRIPVTDVVETCLRTIRWASLVTSSWSNIAVCVAPVSRQDISTVPWASLSRRAPASTTRDIALNLEPDCSAIRWATCRTASCGTTISVRCSVRALPKEIQTKPLLVIRGHISCRTICGTMKPFSLCTTILSWHRLRSTCFLIIIICRASTCDNACEVSHGSRFAPETKMDRLVIANSKHVIPEGCITVRLGTRRGRVARIMDSAWGIERFR